MNRVINTDRSLIKDIFQETTCLTHDQLKAYLKKQVTGRERFNIENHLIECELCNDALEGLNISESEKVTKQDLKSLKNALHSRFMIKSTKNIAWKPYLAMAAVVLLAVVTVFSLLQPQSAEKALFTKYFQPYPNVIPFVRGADSYSIMENAMMEYEAEHYKNASALLSDILVKNPDHIMANFYTGLIDLILKRSTDAVPHLQKVISSYDNDFMEAAAWYLGLTYLRNDDMEKGKEIFHRIADQDGLFTEEAIDLLNELE